MPQQMWNALEDDVKYKLEPNQKNKVHIFASYLQMCQ